MCFYLRDANTDAKAYGLNLNRFPSINLQPPPPTSLPLLHFPFPIFPFSSATSFAARLSIFELHPHSERHVSKHGGFLAGLKWGRGTEEQEKRRRKRRDSSSSRDCLCQPCGSATSLAPIVVAAVCWRLPRQSQIDFPKKNALDVGYIGCQMKVVKLEINLYYIIKHSTRSVDSPRKHVLTRYTRGSSNMTIKTYSCIFLRRRI